MVPDQYFALRSPAGNYLHAEQWMVGWASLYDVATRRRYSVEQEGVINREVKQRIIASVGHTVFRLGLADVGLGATEHLHSRNVLVPEDASDLRTAPICLIDQPAHGLFGALAAIEATQLTRVSLASDPISTYAPA